ncbi:MAG: DNA helicase II / ATP-dependent DNA helicase PcrA [Parcubacteria bacterium C7867-004]|nr:MAG: DNA helicase II / ATP-dependent DNA helicase PcrA [Parcubacteria bacterium C7867-004]
MKDTKAFDEAYAKLNPAQKQAVDTVEGPVLVIAGPGTGKTHILTLRIANILKTTQDTAPENILVLTFTDSAARTVAKRLGGLIGEEAARKVGTYTFHSFAEHIMKEYPEAFSEYTDRRLMGEVEQVLLWRDVLENLKQSKLRTPKSPFHYLKDLKSLEDTLTRECVSIEQYQGWLDEEEERMKDDPKLRYVRGGKGGAAGELNPTGVKKIERLEKGREAAGLIETYRAEKEARGLYGYTDVLRIATDALAEDEALRADLQEKYQYVLADEHQDANALQHALLDALAFDEHPNLFIVGDEKQAVFGFQGADTTHFKTFLTLYPRTTVIALTENYRSYQDILDLSHTLLADLPSSSGEHVRLSGFRGAGGKMHLLQSEDPLAERDQVATLVQEAIDEGVAPHEIAIITLKNKTADLFALHLRARGIPTLRAGDIDLDGRPSIRFLLALMQAIANPNENALLREALLAPWWEPSLAERATFLRQHRDYELTDALAVSFPGIAGTIAHLREQVVSLPPLNVLSYLLKDSGARAFFLSGGEQVSEDIPLVRQIIAHVEDLTRRDPNATFGEIMDSLAKAREHEIGSIKTSLTQREGQVTVITAHKAKGMEFERVFVTALTAREWEGRGKSALVPSMFDSTREKEELVRLFYVALTRAKNELVLSYAASDMAGKEQAPLSLLPSGLSVAEVESDPIPLMHTVIDAPELARELTCRYLEHDGLSPSAYNEYLASPPTFFAKRVLRLSEPESRAIAVGNAVHAAIAAYLKRKDAAEDERAAAAHAELSRSLSRSLLQRGDTFDELTRHAHASLDSYLGSELLTREAIAIEEAFSVKRTIDGKEIVLKGKVDAVFKGDRGECIVDFKTSSTIDKKDAQKFERQLAFYDLLLRENGHETDSALIIQVGEEEVTEHPVALTDETRAELAGTLDEVLRELISGKWRKGEPSEYDDLLKLFGT